MSKVLVFRFTLALAFINLVITALLGIALRLHPIVVFSDFNFRHWTHAHSHVAFLGWVFLALMGLIHYYFLQDKPSVNRHMFGLVVFFQFTVLGMMFTFPFTGYALWSIVFSSLHMFGSFYLAWYVHKQSTYRRLLPFKFISAALWFMIISSIGPLALGPIVAMGLKQTMWYNLAIYFYLHFQYNGWFILAIIGILMVNKESGFLLNYERKFQRGYSLLIWGVIITYALSALGFRPHNIVYWVGGVGAILQLIGFLYLLKIFTDPLKDNLKLLYAVFVGCLLAKLVLQLLSAIPDFTSLAYFNKDIVIAYLHMVLLGVVTIYLINAILDFITTNVKLYNWVAITFLTGFLVTEGILLLRGFQLIPTGISHYLLVFGGFCILLTALLMLSKIWTGKFAQSIH